MSQRLARLATLLLVLVLLLPASPVRADDPQPLIGEPAVYEPTVGEIPNPQPLFTGCTRVNVAAQNAAYEQQVVELVNQERNTVGLPPLKRNTDLDYAARFHSKDLLDDNYFEHNSYDRQGDNLVQVCEWSTRVSNFFSNWNNLGENIAWGYATPADVMQGWMNSAGHKANILNSGYRELGVGYYSSRWTQDFGARSGIYPLVINREASSTDLPQVSLYIYRQDTTWTEMRLRNDGGAWTAWQPFSATLAWTLDWAKGTRTVTVEVRKGSTVRSASDTIDLTTAGNTLGNLPDALRFIYNQGSGRMIPTSATLQPLNTSSSMTLNWQASAADSWLNPQPGSGSTPNANLTLVPSGSILQSPGRHATTLTVNVTDPPTQASPKVVQVELIVVDALDHFLFLSSIQR